VRVPNLQKTSKFYQDFFGMKLAQQSETIHILSVGESFFGIEQKPDVAALDHFDFGLEGWDAKAMRAKVAAHGLSITAGSRGDDESFKFNDPDGFVVQVNQISHVGPTRPARNMKLHAARRRTRSAGHSCCRPGHHLPQRRDRHPRPSGSRQRAARH
jgi:catechol 2,3-dioxygenase-like lactoylglutathione lyase family enzyme